jgi:hypothetical protein
MEVLCCPLLRVAQNEGHKSALQSQNLPEFLSQYINFAVGMIPGRDERYLPSPKWSGLALNLTYPLTRRMQVLFSLEVKRRSVKLTIYL